MLKLVVATLVLGVILLLAFVNPSPAHDVLQTAEFPADNSTNRVNIAELQTLRIGAPLFHALNNRPFAIVAAIDPAYEFSDGTIAPAVMVEFKGGTQLWLQRKHLSHLHTHTPEHRFNQNGATTEK
ncbi:MAG TPA: hypothetical protein VF773_20965 [Verrucomicrobiae bacterium]